MFIRVQFMDGYHASNQGHKDWPPSPARLHAAMVHGLYLRARNLNDQLDYQETRAAMEWFEKLPPPDIRCDRLLEPHRAPPIVFCPIQDKSPAYKKRQARQFHVSRALNENVYYHWDDCDSHHWAGIAKVLEYVPYLGAAKSFAKLNLGEDLPEEAAAMTLLQPQPHGRRQLHCYHEGRLADLDAWYEIGEPPNQGSDQGYDSPRPTKAECRRTNLGRPYIFRFRGCRTQDIQDVNILAGNIRSTLLKIGSKLGIESRALIAHDINVPHCSYLPLPFVGRRGDGTILGFAVTIPDNLSDQDERDCQAILSRLAEATIDNNKIEVPQHYGRPRTLRESTWTRQSTCWSSVTPLEVKWNTDKGISKKEKTKANAEYIVRNCQQLGLPPVTEIAPDEHSRFQGVPPARSFKHRRRDHGYLTHCTIRFAEPLEGFLALCRSRHFGLGLMKPVVASGTVVNDDND